MGTVSRYKKVEGKSVSLSGSLKEERTMAKKERKDDDVGALKGSLLAIGIAVATGACVSAGRDMYETARDGIGNWRERRRKRKAKEATNGNGSKSAKAKAKAAKAKKKAAAKKKKKAAAAK